MRAAAKTMSLVRLSCRAALAAAMRRVGRLSWTGALWRRWREEPVRERGWRLPPPRSS